MRALAIDQSSASGWALESPEGYHESGIFRLPRERNREGLMYLTLYRQVSNLITANAVTHVYFEQTFIAPPRVRGGKIVYSNQGPDYTQQISLTGAIMMAAERYGLPYAQVLIADWRYHFIKVRGAPKTLRGTDARRNWLKDEVIRECQRRGYAPEDDNEADALGILHYVISTRGPAEARGALL